MDRSLVATIYHSNAYEELFSGQNILLPERPGGEISTEAKRPGAKRPEGKRRPADRLFQMTSFHATLSILSICAKSLFSGKNGVRRNDFRILDGKIVICFTHYKVNLRQILDLIEEARLVLSPYTYIGIGTG